MPATTTFVPGTLTTTRGTSDESGRADARGGRRPAAIGETVTITFRVTVNAGAPAGTVISNQGSVDSSSTAPEPTDWDGVEANGDQPTDVVVGTTSPPENALYLQKVVELADDLVPALGTVNAGDVMRYTFIFTNTGPTTLQNVVAERHGTRRASPPCCRRRARCGSALPASPAAAPPSTSPGRASPSPSRQSPPGEFVTATFGVQVIDPLIDLNGGPTDETFVNQATASADGVSPGALRRQRRPERRHPADQLRGASVRVVRRRRSSTSRSASTWWSIPPADGVVNPGDTLEYVVAIRNAGSATSMDTRLSDPVPGQHHHRSRLRGDEPRRGPERVADRRERGRSSPGSR